LKSGKTIYWESMSHFLLKAARMGDAGKVKLLLDGGADVDYHSKDKQGTGRTALSEAAIHGHLEVVRLLLDHRAAIEWKDRAVGYTPLGWAACQGFEDIVRMLLVAGADPNAASDELLHTPLMGVTSVNIAKLLVEAGANPNAKTRDGRTALSFARNNNHHDMVSWLTAINAMDETPTPKPTLESEPRYVPHGGMKVAKRAAQQSTETPPDDVLKAFFAAMFQWEEEAYQASDVAKKSGRGQPVKQLLQQKMAILSKYCTPKRRVYSEAVSITRPSSYDHRTQPITRIEAESGSRVVIYTQQLTGFQNEQRFVLLRRGGKWLMDSMQWRCGGVKWERGIL
jgi:hypothetical protein